MNGYSSHHLLNVFKFIIVQTWMNSFNSVSIHTQYVAGLWNECILIRFVWQCMDDINSFSARIQELGVHGPNSWLQWLMMLWLLLVFGTHHTSYWLTLSYRLWHVFFSSLEWIVISSTLAGCIIYACITKLSPWKPFCLSVESKFEQPLKYQCDGTLKITNTNTCLLFKLIVA